MSDEAHVLLVIDNRRPGEIVYSCVLCKLSVLFYLTDSRRS